MIYHKRILILRFHSIKKKTKKFTTKKNNPTTWLTFKLPLGQINNCAYIRTYKFNIANKSTHTTHTKAQKDVELLVQTQQLLA